MADRRGRAFVGLLLTGLLATVASCALVLWLSHRPALAWAAGVLVAGALAPLLALSVQREAARLARQVAALPNVGEAMEPALREFAPLADALEDASVALRARLDAAATSRRELEVLLDSMQDPVVAVDAAGRIGWTNERMQQLLPRSGLGGVRVGHALVQTIRDPEVLECVRVALAEGALTERRSTSLLPGRIFSISASPTPGGGVVAVLHDMTRVEEVERTQRDFVANVSHEMRTPLTSISGYVELLLDHEAGLSARAREFLDTILTNAARMTRLTEDLLVMARVEASTLQLHPEPIGADELIADALRGLDGLLLESGAVLRLGERTDALVLADHDAALQVLGNLIENAVKYGRNGKPAEVIVSARETPDEVEFAVVDHGPGIASEHLPRIFERFYRVDKARSRESGGTGLGLSIVRHMVQAHGGSIRAESQLGAGSRFLFTLPKAPEGQRGEDFTGNFSAL